MSIRVVNTSRDVSFLEELTSIIQQELPEFKCMTMNWLWAEEPFNTIPGFAARCISAQHRSPESFGYVILGNPIASNYFLDSQGGIYSTKQYFLLHSDECFSGQVLHYIVCICQIWCKLSKLV